MSKLAAIHYAVSAEFASIGINASDLTRPFQDVFPVVANETPDERKRRCATAAVKLLANVAMRLRSDAPPFEFNWPALKIEDVLTDPIYVLVDRIGVSSAALLPQGATPTAATPAGAAAPAGAK